MFFKKSLVVVHDAPVRKIKPLLLMSRGHLVMEIMAKV